jgi:ubiquinone/menaquinone biosynthesis C-methylase UbiE
MICPWWLGYGLIIPLRRLLQDPRKLLSPYVKDGMRVLDIGSGMGYFSLPMARMVGDRGRVICVDLQEKMIAHLMRRAHQAGLADRIEPRFARRDSLMIPDRGGMIDFALAFAVMHEIEDKEKIFREVFTLLKHGCRFLVAEPRGHVNPQAFERTLAVAVEEGFEVGERPDISLSHAAMLCKP